MICMGDVAVFVKTFPTKGYAKKGKKDEGGKKLKQ